MFPAKAIPLVLSLLLALGCDGSNSSDLRADFATVRVRELVLSDAQGKPVAVLSAARSAAGAPTLVVRDPAGAVLRTIALAAPAAGSE